MFRVDKFLGWKGEEVMMLLLSLRVRGEAKPTKVKVVTLWQDKQTRAQ